MCEFRYLNKRTLQNQTRCKTSSATQGKLELEFLPKFCVDHFEAPQRAVHLCSVDQLLPWEDVPNHPGGYINPLSSNSNSDHRCKIHELIYRRGRGFQENPPSNFSNCLNQRCTGAYLTNMTHYAQKKKFKSKKITSF